MCIRIFGCLIQMFDIKDDSLSTLPATARPNRFNEHLASLLSFLFTQGNRKDITSFSFIIRYTTILVVVRLLNDDNISTCRVYIDDINT